LEQETMTIPTQVLAFVRGIETTMAQARQHADTLTGMSEHASGPEAIGYAALAVELEQVGKVLRNYMPRLMKHVGEMPEASDEVPEPLADLARESEPYGETRERLWALFIGIQHKLADDGKTMPKATGDEVILYTRLYPHMGWLAKPGAVEIL